MQLEELLQEQWMHWCMNLHGHFLSVQSGTLLGHGLVLEDITGQLQKLRLRSPQGNAEGWGQCFRLCIHHVLNTLDGRCHFSSKCTFLNLFLDM